VAHIVRRKRIFVLADRRGCFGVILCLDKLGWFTSESQSISSNASTVSAASFCWLFFLTIALNVVVLGECAAVVFRLLSILQLSRISTINRRRPFWSCKCGCTSCNYHTLTKTTTHFQRIFKSAHLRCFLCTVYYLISRSTCAHPFDAKLITTSAYSLQQLFLPFHRRVYVPSMAN
jgi:hypothetical protein